jgi:Rab GDP dissociation inhibitor
MEILTIFHLCSASYLDFKSIAGSYVWKGSKKEIFKVPATSKEATTTSLMGLWQKKNFLQFLNGVKDVNCGLHASNPEEFKCPEFDKITVQQLFDKYGLDENSQDFVGHAMCLRTSDDYKKEPATKSMRALHLYVYSLNHYGVSPYLYPKWGLGGLPESFSRLCAVHGGTFMLERDISEILVNKEGVAIGVRAGEEAATAKFVVGDASYFAPEKTRVTQQVVRSIMILNHPLKSTSNAESAQIIIPANQVAIAGYPAREHDIYVMAVSSENQVCAKGQWIAIVSTEVETKDPIKELQCGLDIVGEYMERFDYVSDYKVPVSDGTKDKMFISESYDATSHFETTTTDVLVS